MNNLVFKILNPVFDVNNFNEVNKLELIQGNTQSIYFQLQSRTGQRYIPDALATIQVTFDHIDSNKTLTRTAIKPFATDDRSVWKLDILATDQIAFNSMGVKISLGADYFTVLPASNITSIDASHKNFC
jgi:hypothetical protein